MSRDAARLCASAFLVEQKKESGEEIEVVDLEVSVCCLHWVSCFKVSVSWLILLGVYDSR